MGRLLCWFWWPLGHIIFIWQRKTRITNSRIWRTPSWEWLFPKTFWIFSCGHDQKGTVGATYTQECMPWTVGGISTKLSLWIVNLADYLYCMNHHSFHAEIHKSFVLAYLQHLLMLNIWILWLVHQQSTSCFTIVSPVSIKEVGERVDLNRNEVRNDTLAEKALFVVLPLEEKGSLIQTASILKLWFLMGPRGRTGSDHYGPSKEGSSSVYSPRLRPPLLPACILHGHPHVLFSQNPRVSSPISPCMPSKIDFQKSCFRIILFLQLFILP